MAAASWSPFYLYSTPRVLRNLAAYLYCRGVRGGSGDGGSGTEPPLCLDSKTNYGRGRAMMAVAPAPFYLLCLLRELGYGTMAEEEGRVRGWGWMGDCDSY